MDLLHAVRRRNPALAQTAAALHRDGAVPAGSYVLDLDAVGANAALVARAIASAGLAAYYEAKQFGRCPPAGDAIVEAGFSAAIALDSEEAHALHEQGRRIGHAGHLGQPVRAELRWLVEEVRPEVVTVYDLARAAELSQAAVAAGRVQNVLLRPVGPADLQLDLVAGGTPEADLPAAAEAVRALPGLRLVGVTSYPALRYDVRERRFRGTPNLETLARARERLERAGVDVRHVNAAGNACVASAALLAAAGATHVEPGHAFVGGTPGHFFEDLPEVPALVYVTEITHTSGDVAYAPAGGLVANFTIGLWNPLLYERLEACVGADPATLVERVLTADPPHHAHSDPSAYLYLRLHQAPGLRGAVGDSVVLGVRTQVYRANEARIAAVEGLAAGQPRLLGLWDRTGRPNAAPPAAS